MNFSSPFKTLTICTSPILKKNELTGENAPSQVEKVCNPIEQDKLTKHKIPEISSTK